MHGNQRFAKLSTLSHTIGTLSIPYDARQRAIISPASAAINPTHFTVNSGPQATNIFCFNCLIASKASFGSGILITVLSAYYQCAMLLQSWYRYHGQLPAQISAPCHLMAALIQVIAVSMGCAGWATNEGLKFDTTNRKHL